MMSRMIDDEEALKDNGLIEIDGVDVSECLAFTQEQPHLGINCLNALLKGGKCELNPDCYFKQLQRMKVENERLKAFKRECLKPVCLPDVEPEVINKYKQALEEVREYVNSQVDGFGNYVYGITKQQVKDITDKINEVLKDE